jgi:hypothetical protein
MRPSSCVATFNQKNEAGDVEELCFGETEQEVVGACHEDAIRHWTHNVADGERQEGRLPIPWAVVILRAAGTRCSSDDRDAVASKGVCGNVESGGLWTR